ncbi:DNA-formamidopyrimidine glycosylase, partial [Candidatus Phytoplasma phoenicium]
FLLFFLSNEWVLVGHLRMEGKIYLHLTSQCAPVQDKHEHFRLFLENNLVFRFYDFRKFARFNLYKKDKYLKESKLCQLAPDPFSISLETFYQKLQKSSTINIKQALLNQKIISGIGNIYASEILFLTQIHPEMKANKLILEKVRELLNKTKKVLTKAIEAGGTSISTFEVLGVKGNFQKQLLVYGKDKQKCYFCPKLIQKIKINGRSSYFCEQCQKI